MENNIKQSFSIGEIAELLNIPTSTLRFWEKKGFFLFPNLTIVIVCILILILFKLQILFFTEILGFPSMKSVNLQTVQQKNMINIFWKYKPTCLKK